MFSLEWAQASYCSVQKVILASLHRKPIPSFVLLVCAKNPSPGRGGWMRTVWDADPYGKFLLCQERTVGDAGPYGIEVNFLLPFYETNGIMLVYVEKLQGIISFL